MSEPKPRKRSLSIHAVEVAGLGVPAVFYVRHFSVSQAKALVSDAFVKARKATDDEMIEIGRNGYEVIGPEPPAPLSLDDGQMPLGLDDGAQDQGGGE